MKTRAKPGTCPSSRVAVRPNRCGLPRSIRNGHRAGWQSIVIRDIIYLLMKEKTCPFNTPGPSLFSVALRLSPILGYTPEDPTRPPASLKRRR